MATATVPTAKAAGQSLRIDVDDAKRRLGSNESVTVLDVRAEKSWAESPVKMHGAIRARPDQFRIDPQWPADRLTVVY